MNIVEIDIFQIKSSKVFEFRYDQEMDNFALKKSIQSNGQIRPIVIDQENEIIDGNKIYKFIMESGQKTISCVQMNINSESEYVMKRLELNTWNKMIDPIVFYKYLKQIKESNMLDKLNVPFKSQSIEGWIELLSWDWDKYKNKQLKSPDTLW